MIDTPNPVGTKPTNQSIPLTQNNQQGNSLFNQVSKRYIGGINLQLWQTES